MLGAIAGDSIGSKFEFHNINSKNFAFKPYKYTDDSTMSLAIAKALLETKDSNYDNLAEKTTYWMRDFGKKYTLNFYGGFFRCWIKDEPLPYKSFGNGAAMRISAVGRVANSLDQALTLAETVTKITHSHEEAIKAAQAIAAAIYLARTGWTKDEIMFYILQNFYAINFTLDTIRDSYFKIYSSRKNPIYFTREISQCSVPEALEAFWEATSYEDAIRNCISIGGDTDTTAAIIGGLAEAYWGIPKELAERTRDILKTDRSANPPKDSTELLNILNEFEKEYPPSEMRIDESQISQKEKELHEETKKKIEKIKSELPKNKANDEEELREAIKRKFANDRQKKLSSQETNIYEGIDFKTFVGLIFGIALLDGNKNTIDDMANDIDNATNNAISSEFWTKARGLLKKTSNKELLDKIDKFEKKYSLKEMHIDKTKISTKEKVLHTRLEKSNSINIKTILAIIFGFAFLAGTAIVAALTFGAALIPALVITKIAIALGVLFAAALFIYAAFNQKAQNDKCRNLSNNSLTKDNNKSINKKITKEIKSPNMKKLQQESQKL